MKINNSCPIQLTQNELKEVHIVITDKILNIHRDIQLGNINEGEYVNDELRTLCKVAKKCAEKIK